MTAPLLVLASQSPGRAGILRSAGVAFRQIVSDVDEDAALARAEQSAGTPLTSAETALLLARLKAEAVSALQAAQGSLVLGCDSVFEFNGIPHGKPYTQERAIERLREQSSGTGVLHSGHWLVDARNNAVRSPAAGRLVSTSVTFGELDDDLIAAYVATGEPLHCAGAFTIDARGAALIERIDGDPAAVVGLSVFALKELLGELGVSMPEVWTG